MTAKDLQASVGGPLGWSVTANSSRDAQHASIALVSAYYPSHDGGIERVAEELALGLSAIGHQVDWLALDEQPPQPQKNLAITPLSGTDAVYQRSGLPFPLIGWAATRALRNSIKNCDICVINEANFMASVFAFALARKLRKPTILVQHVGSPATNSALARTIMNLAEAAVVQPMIRQANQIIFVSSVVQRHFSQVKCNGPAELIGHGVRTDVFRPAGLDEKIMLRESFCFPSDAKIACFAGRLTVTKGVEILAEMARLRPDWHFAVAGDGPYDLSGLNLRNLTAFGQLEQERLAALFRCSDLLLLPSQSESFSLVVREAMASEIAVLCNTQVLETDPNLEPYVMTCSVDLSRPRETALSFAKQLDQVPAYPRQAARAYVTEHCSWDAIIARYSTLVQTIASIGNGTSA